ncbi:hypothetical protein LSCM1_05375 [Leishmania martiniquensis]|uniref:BRCT domain-containing protein n=1 Tax=Leishmania martiniquensis TaxID=1580590 RepID=A0A836KL55_9TRYP|nr:hypothetical protein LSCM1_05375 [Leishmania martiniquensis]
MSSAAAATAAACPSRPLSGVRVFLHIRLGPSCEDVGRRSPGSAGGDNAKKRKGEGSRASARDVLRTARAHVQQLGATLALSEAAADLVVFHRGSISFLEAAHMKFKTVVRPEYLAACVAADQRVSIAPYIVTPSILAAAAICTALELPSAGATSPATPLSYTLANPPEDARKAATAAGNIPSSARSGTKNCRPAGGSAAAAPLCAPHSRLRYGAETTVPAEEPKSPSQPHRLRFLDEEEDGGEVSNQEQQARLLVALARAAAVREEGAVAVTVASSSTPSPLHATSISNATRGATKSCHPLDGMPKNKTHVGRCAPEPLPSDEAVGQKRAEKRNAHVISSSSSVMPQQRRSSTRTKRGAHLVSTAAVELDEVITQQPSTGTASTPRLTPLPRHEVGSDGSLGAGTVVLPERSTCSESERAAAALRRRAADTEEEEAIRHAVLRSTATAAVTRRRGRPPKPGDAAALRVDRMPSDQDTMLKPDRDPFLDSEGSTQRQPRQSLASALHPTELNDVEVAFTQPLAASSPSEPTGAAVRQAPSAVSVAPTRKSAKRPRSSSSASEGSTVGPVYRTPTAPANTAQRKCQRRSKQGVTGGAVDEAIRKSSKRRQQQQQRQTGAQRRRRVPSRGTAEILRNLEHAPAAEPTFSMTFTDLSLLRPLASGEEGEGGSWMVTRLCVHIFLEAVSEVDTSGGDAAAAAALSFFLRDVVEQLGAACVVLGSDDRGEHPCWFSRCERVRVGWRSCAAKKPTHLVVSLRAALTPDILYCKALGIPIVTPQWLHDAIALGAFPSILPHIHAHPVYGDRHVAGARVNVAVVAAAAPAAGVGVPRRDGLLGAEEEYGYVVEGDTLWAHANLALSSMSSSTSGSAAVLPADARAVAAGPRCPRRCAGFSTLQQLHKEVVEEYVPASEQAMRPFYQPVFQDRMFYLYVPPADLVNANATGGGARPLRPRRASRNDHRGSCLGDAVAALAQVAALLRLLGGTVTRNLASTHLDLVIDLTGFYDSMAEMGLTAGGQPWQQGRTRALRESLSCAFHDAVRHVSQQPTSMGAGDAAITTATSLTAPPVVGIAWLIHSIFMRQWTAVDSFVLDGHPLAAQIAALHPCAQASAAVDTGATRSRDHATVCGAVAARGVEAAGAPGAAMVTPCARAPVVPPSHEEAAESPSSSLWSAVVAAAAAPHVKCAQGPQAALKQASHQLSTQEIAVMLGDTRREPLGVPGKAAPSTSPCAPSSPQSARTPFWVKEEASLTFANVQDSELV